ncbi:tail protein X [Xanthobacter tagetidis]|uniref:Phage tail protein n=1 Tax=Xanthobacter tagetidis TaxID=60216 RepID=A0A3L7AJJ2_9HYPH|nr:tail protein X [Xanthobacter tagetidis]MBB6308899.1 phage tail protein X [Xanthobacter tagetidis]RLP80589.1 phage tail protein [Xanthobacter tagetidis]
MDYDIVEVKADGTALDLLIWRRHKRPMPGLMEAALDANPGLAAHGPLLPVGTMVRLPRPQPSAAAPTVVRLWD